MVGLKLGRKYASAGIYTSTMSLTTTTSSTNYLCLCLQNAEFVLCIDGIGQQSDSNTMYMHVSKPPKEGTHMNSFYKQLRTTAQSYENVTVEGIHKKINLAEVQLAWEHERFSMKRMPGFTLSSLKSHKDPLRSTIFVENQERNLQTAQRNAKILAEALGAYVFGNNNGELFSGSSVIFLPASVFVVVQAD